MMTILLERRKFLRATHLPLLRRERNDYNSPKTMSDTFTSPELFLCDGSGIEIVSSFAPEVRYATCNQSEQGSKTLLFLDQSDKSPDSGLRADYW